MADVDYVAATLTYLLADAEVAGEVGTRGWGGDLPRAEASAMPRKAFVLREAGGSGGPGARSWLEVSASRLDVRAYGATRSEAATVARAIKRALKRLGRRVVGTVLLIGSTESGGIAELLEPDVDWPLAFASYEITYSEVPTA